MGTAAVEDVSLGSRREAGEAGEPGLVGGRVVPGLDVIGTVLDKSRVPLAGAMDRPEA